MKHCIKAVWEKETVPEDDDEVEIAINKAPLIISKLCRCARSARRWLGRQETPSCPTKPRFYSCSLKAMFTLLLKQEELREVFDGSCDLIPVGLIAKECKALVEQFVPELVETLASEMNPDT